MVAGGNRGGEGAILEVDGLTVEPSGLHAREDERLLRGGGSGEARRGVEATRIEFLGQLAVDERVDRRGGGGLGEGAGRLVVEDPEAGDVALAGVKRTRLTNLAEEGVEVAAGDARDAFGQAGGHDATDVVATHDVGLEDGEFDAGAGTDEEFSRVLARWDADHLAAVLHLEREAVVAFLHLRGRIQHALDDVVQRGAGADTAEVGAELAAGSADGVAQRATGFTVVDFAVRGIGAQLDPVDDASDLGFVIARTGLGAGERFDGLDQRDAASAERAGGLQGGGQVFGAQALREFFGEALRESSDLEEIRPHSGGFFLRLDLGEHRGDGLVGFARSMDGQGGEGVATHGRRAGFSREAAERGERRLLSDRAQGGNGGLTEGDFFFAAGEVADLRDELD